MASRFWVGGAGTWDATTTHWSLTSGGANGASVPTSAEDVVFDANSGGGAVTISFGSCASWSTSGFTGSFISNGGITCTGNVTFASSLTGFTWSGTLSFAGAGTLTGFASTVYTCAISNSIAASSVRVVSNFNSSALFNNINGITQLTSDCTWSTYRSGALTNKLDFNGHQLTLSGAVASQWDLDGTGTSSIDMSAVGSKLLLNTLGGNTNFKGAGLTYTSEVKFHNSTGSSIVTVTGNNTFQNLICSQAAGASMTVAWTASSTNIIEGGGTTNPYGPGIIVSAPSKLTFKSTVNGTQYTLSKSTNPMLMFNCDLRDCIGGGAAAVHISKSGVNSGNNTNWVMSGPGFMALF